MTKTWTLASCAASLVLAWVGACGGDGAADQDASPPLDGAAPGDPASGDAAVVDCSGDHRESAENTNDPFSDGESPAGSAERTGLSVAAGGDGFTVCGELHPGQATAQLADYDAFEFTVGGGRPVNVRIEMVASVPGAAIELNLLRVVDEGPAMELAKGPFRNGYALVAGKLLTPGTYWVSAAAWLPAPERPIGYSISVRENDLSCLPSADMAYLEMGDGLDSRGNDVVAVKEGTQPPKLTEVETDLPEMTGIDLDPEEVHRVQGMSGSVLSDGDSFRDRDTYLLATGPNTTELELRLTWADANNADLDMYLFGAEQPDNDYSVKLGRTSGSLLDEVMTLNVDPSRSYWLWVGALDTDLSVILPLPYDVTLCPREHGVSPAPTVPPR